MEDNSENQPPQGVEPAEAAASAEPTVTPAATANAGAEGSESAERDGDDADDAEGGEATEGEDAAASGDATKKRKRRRRRKKKKDGVEAGAEGAPAGEAKEPAKKKDPASAPFGRYFAQGGKRHAFAVGEVIAGRVTVVADGAITVDLFGKAIAIADVNEPRDVPVIEQPAEPVAAAPQVTADATSVVAPTVEAAAGATEPSEPHHDEATASAIEAVMAEAEAAEGETETSAGVVETPELPAEAVPLPELEPPALGTVFKGRIGAVAESGHIAILNRIIDVPATRARIERYRQERRRVHGLVYGFNRGGFDVLVEGLRAFCPVSGMSLGEVEDPHAYIAKNLEFSLPPAKPGTRARDIIVSRRTILEKQQRKAARDLVRNLQQGQRLTGRVTQVREFGAFVDIGGIEGLIHQSELSYNRALKPEDVVKVGDTVEVQVLGVAVEPKKERRARVSLSIKALQQDPWEAHKAAIAEGSVCTGKVTTTTDFGAFLEIAPGIEGLLHISELGRELKHANQVLNAGDEIVVVVERADRKTRRISLSKLSEQEISEHEEGKLAGAERGPKSLRPGETIKVKIEKVEPRGVVVRVAGVIGRRGRGYLPASETGTDRGADLRKAFPAGNEIEVKIIGNDRDGGLRCSVKALAIDEERKAIKDYRKAAAKQGFGTFGDLLRAKLDSSSK